MKERSPLRRAEDGERKSEEFDERAIANLATLFPLSSPLLLEKEEFKEQRITVKKSSPHLFPPTSDLCSPSSETFPLVQLPKKR